MTEDDDGFIPGFARKNKAEALTAATKKVIKEAIDDAVTDVAEELTEQLRQAPVVSSRSKGGKIELQRQRYAKAAAALVRWERKQRIAAGRVAKYAAQVKRYEKILIKVKS